MYWPSCPLCEPAKNVGVVVIAFGTLLLLFHASDTRTYGPYTTLNQLQKLDEATAWSYDSGDNMTAMAGGVTLSNHDPANQLGTATRATNATTMGYDTRGNRTSATPAVGPGTTYGYDDRTTQASDRTLQRTRRRCPRPHLL